MEGRVGRTEESTTVFHREILLTPSNSNRIWCALLIERFCCTGHTLRAQAVKIAVLIPVIDF